MFIDRPKNVQLGSPFQWWFYVIFVFVACFWCIGNCILAILCRLAPAWLILTCLAISFPGLRPNKCRSHQLHHARTDCPWGSPVPRRLRPWTLDTMGCSIDFNSKDSPSCYWSTCISVDGRTFQPKEAYYQTLHFSESRAQNHGSLWDSSSHPCWNCGTVWACPKLRHCQVQ